MKKAGKDGVYYDHISRRILRSYLTAYITIISHGVYYDHISRRIYGEYVVYINVVAQKAPEKFVVRTDHDRPELIKHMERVGRFVAEDLFPIMQRQEGQNKTSST